MTPPAISVVVFRQGSRWVAQCLEVNIAVSAERRPELLSVLKKRLQGQMLVDARRGVEPFSEFSRAGSYYWDMLQQARPWRREELREPLVAKILRGIRRLGPPTRRLELAEV